MGHRPIITTNGEFNLIKILINVSDFERCDNQLPPNNCHRQMKRVYTRLGNASNIEVAFTTPVNIFPWRRSPVRIGLNGSERGNGEPVKK